MVEGGGGGELELHDGAHDMVGDMWNEETQDSCVRLSDGSGGFHLSQR